MTNCSLLKCEQVNCKTANRQIDIWQIVNWATGKLVNWKYRQLANCELWQIGHLAKFT